MTRREWMRIGLCAPAGFAVAAPVWGASKEFWETKPHSEWSSAEVERMLTKSPWAKEVIITANGRMSTSGGYPGGGNRGGYPGGGYPGGGYPGGGVGFPGGGIGYPGGSRYPGGGYPGGGYPGGGYPGGPNGGNYPDGRGARTYRATLRWESSQAIQDALVLGSEGTPNPDFAKYYVLSLIGDLPDDSRDRGYGNDRSADDRDSGDSRSDDEDSDRQKRRRDAMFKEFTKLERKDGVVKFEKVVEGSRFGSSSPGTAFYFSRLDNITPEDKVISFYTKVNNMEVRAKFTLKEMMYQGKLAL